MRARQAFLRLQPLSTFIVTRKKKSIYIYISVRCLALQKELEKDLLENTIPAKLACFQKRLEANSGGKGFFAGDKVKMIF